MRASKEWTVSDNGVVYSSIRLEDRSNNGLVYTRSKQPSLGSDDARRPIAETRLTASFRAFQHHVLSMKDGERELPPGFAHSAS